jgi:hypothetical protein
MSFWQTIRIAARTWRWTPVLAAVIASTLALGIGATTAAFTIACSILVQHFPFPNAERLVWITNGENIRGMYQRARDQPAHAPICSNVFRLYGRFSVATFLPIRFVGSPRLRVERCLSRRERLRRDHHGVPRPSSCRVVEDNRTIELRGQAVARAKPVALIAERHLHRAFEHPDLLERMDTSRAVLECDALAWWELDFNDLHRLRHARGRDDATAIARSRVLPLWLIFAAR